MMGWVAGSVWLVAFIACSIIEIVKSQKKIEELTLLSLLILCVALFVFLVI